MNLSSVKKKLQKKVIGIDIDDRSIEVVELAKGEDNNIKISSLSRIVLDSHIVKRGRIKDPKRLAKAMRKVLDRALPHPILKNDNSMLDSLFMPQVIFGLPESQVYTHIFDSNTKELKGGKIEDIVLKEVYNTIPIDKKDLIYSYKLLNKFKEKSKILVIAASREVMQEWQIFFKQFNIKIEYFDSEILAEFRGLLIKNEKLPICIIDIGSITTAISIFDANGLLYSYSINIAGESLTKEIAKNLKIDIRQAEDDKIRYGLDVSKKIFPILIKVLEPVVSEIKVALDFFKKETGKKIENILLIGGSSKLKGLEDFLKTNLGIEEVSIGNSILIKEKSPLEYIESVGLALAGFDNKKKNKTFLYLEASKKSMAEILQEIKKVIKKKTIGKISQFFAQKGSFTRNTIKIDKNIFSKNILYIFIIIAIILLAFAFWYREAQRDIRSENRKSKVSRLAQMQGIKIEVQVAVSDSEYKDERARGRIILDKIEVAQTYSQAIEESKEEAQKGLKKGEVLWDTPLNKGDEDNVIFPIKLNWLAYNEEEVNLLIVKEIDKINKEEIDYIVNNIRKNRVYKKADNANIFYIEARIIISSHKLIDAIQEINNQTEEVEEELQIDLEKEEEKSEEEEEAEEQAEEPDEYSSYPKATIKETEFGWLNVRTGPGASYDILTKVYPGESYPLLETSGKWYKIKIDVDRVGWTHSHYIIKN